MNQAPLDDRITQVQLDFKLTKHNVNKFWSVFRVYDNWGNGHLTLDLIFRDIIDEPRNFFGESLFSLTEVNDMNRIGFGDLLHTVTSFAMFEVCQNHN